MNNPKVSITNMKLLTVIQIRPERRHLAFDAMFPDARVAPNKVGNEGMEYRPDQTKAIKIKIP